MVGGQGSSSLRGEDPPPVHPGFVLKRDYLLPIGCTQVAFARRIGIRPQTLSDIVHGQHSITPEIALSLEDVLDTPAEMWMHAQADYGLARARLARLAGAPGTPGNNGGARRSSSYPSGPVDPSGSNGRHNGHHRPPNHNGQGHRRRGPKPP
jgi:addiction module HigA family antidote